MQTIGERTKTQELFDIAARVATVGTYGSKVYSRVGYRNAMAILNSAASSAGSSVTNTVTVQESDALAAGSKDDKTETVANDIKLRSAANTAIKLSAKVTQSGARQVAKVFLMLKSLGTIAAGKIVTVRLETDSTGDPSGTLVHADATKDVLCSTIGSSYSLVEFAFTRPVDIADTTVFHIVLTGDYTESATACIILGTADVASGGDYNIYDSAWGTLDTTKLVVGGIEEYNFSDISGAAFTVVSELAALHEKIDVSLEGKKAMIRAKCVVAGSSASFQCGASLVLGDCPDMPVSG